MDNANLIDKRKFIRIAEDHVLCHEKYHFRVQAEKESVEGVVKNYSAGGALFESKIKYDIGDLLKLDITIPGWEKYKNEFYKNDKLFVEAPVVVLVNVVRVEAIVPDELYDIGVSFVGIDNGDQWALMKQIKEHIQ